jgi:hypothetical protein
VPLFLFGLLHFDYTILQSVIITLGGISYQLVPISVVCNNLCIQSAVIDLQCFSVDILWLSR